MVISFLLFFLRKENQQAEKVARVPCALIKHDLGFQARKMFVYNCCKKLTYEGE